MTRTKFARGGSIRDRPDLCARWLSVVRFGAPTKGLPFWRRLPFCPWRYCAPTICSILNSEFVNMTLLVGADLANPAPPELAGVAGKSAFIIVDFPPQHILEQVLTGAGNPPYPARISGPSRLTFAVPAALLPVPYGLQSVLTLLTKLTPLMQGDVPDGVGATAVEFPYGLVLAPAAGAPARILPPPRSGGVSSQRVDRALANAARHAARRRDGAGHERRRRCKPLPACQPTQFRFPYR